MHKLVSSFVLGYHGCDRDTAERLLSNEPFEPSNNEYDWLGGGIYFWQENPVRALEFAYEQIERKRVKDPDLVGAVIDLGHCLDFTSSWGIKLVSSAYDDFIAYLGSVREPVPENRLGKDKLLRALDCAVINHLHEVRKQLNLPEFDSVKGIFLEGNPVYPNAGFHKKTHTQLCVRQQSSIKGVFRVPESDLQAFVPPCVD